MRTGQTASCDQGNARHSAPAQVLVHEADLQLGANAADTAAPLCPKRRSNGLQRFAGVSHGDAKLRQTDSIDVHIQEFVRAVYKREVAPKRPTVTEHLLRAVEQHQQRHVAEQMQNHGTRDHCWRMRFPLADATMDHITSTLAHASARTHCSATVDAPADQSPCQTRP
jgi:ribosomal protein L11